MFLGQKLVALVIIQHVSVITGPNRFGVRVEIKNVDIREL